MQGALAGKVVVVVGGTTGIGLSGVRACLGAGARVVALGLPESVTDDLASALGPLARLLPGDARDPDAACGAIQMARSAHGGLDALFHVAGGSGRGFGDGPLHEVTDTAWEETLRLNLTSVFYSNRAAARAFLDAGTPGSVLNVGSVTPFAPSPRFFSTHAYASAKAAIQGLTTSAAAYYAPHGIRFNVLLPGLTETPMSQRASSDPSILEFIRRKQPLEGGRMARPSDLDAAIVFFLSDASRFVTGQALAVDGGWSVSEGIPRA
jgi:NAD(P)-dependent dehydrogenase (short-subunit alcohol dehydrogenase family)